MDDLSALHSPSLRVSGLCSEDTSHDVYKLTHICVRYRSSELLDFFSSFFVAERAMAACVKHSGIDDLSALHSPSLRMSGHCSEDRIRIGRVVVHDVYKITHICVRHRSSELLDFL